MNSIEITRIASLHSHTRPFFGGCLSSDTLPVLVRKYPVFYICNTDMSYERGTHWLLIMLKSPSTHPTFFDSLGYPPTHYAKTIENFMIANSNQQYEYSSVRLQQAGSIKCGMYCLTVADLFCQDKTLTEIIQLFDKDNLNKNEILVSAYVNQHMKKI